MAEHMIKVSLAFRDYRIKLWTNQWSGLGNCSILFFDIGDFHKDLIWNFIAHWTENFHVTKDIIWNDQKSIWAKRLISVLTYKKIDILRSKKQKMNFDTNFQFRNLSVSPSKFIPFCASLHTYENDNSVAEKLSLI